MAETEAFTITLPVTLADKIRELVAAGEFTGASDLVCQSLDTYFSESGQPLGMSDAEFDELIRREVLPVHERMQADPSRGRSVDQIRETLAREHAEFQKAS